MQGQYQSFDAAIISSSVFLVMVKFCLEILSNMPVETMQVNSDEPPKLIKGSVRPVTGIRPTTTQIFIIACAIIMPVIAPAIVLPK
jgi:hypothetical protein